MNNKKIIIALLLLVLLGLGFVGLVNRRREELFRQASRAMSTKLVEAAKAGQGKTALQQIFDEEVRTLAQYRPIRLTVNTSKAFLSARGVYETTAISNMCLDLAQTAFDCAVEYETVNEDCVVRALQDWTQFCYNDFYLIE